MHKYNFKTLSPYEFELLVQDLLQEYLNIRLESFKSGKDGGVDLRYCEDKQETIIIQCKHYSDHFSSLFSSLKKEVLKVKKLNPKKYLLIVSTSLSRENKRKIVELFKGFIKRQKDIYGCEDLNNLLGLYPSIERKHFKLWLSSVEVVEKILHNNIHNRSFYRIEDIRNKICRYVPNKSFTKAEKILDRNNYVVISGSPGIGKTTLADFLIWQYLSKGFEFIEITNDIEEAWKVVKPDSEKQVFYYDDFLGKTNLTQSYSKNEDKRLIQFIEMVQKSKNKKFILTTREYILQEAKMEYEHIDSYPLMKCVIPLKDYTNSIRAKILYNHLFFTNVPQELIDEILCDKRYMKIIKHPNYNPRIIDMYTDKINLTEITKQMFFTDFLNALNFPSKIWEHIYNKLNDSAKAILLTIMTTKRNTLTLENLYDFVNPLYVNITKSGLSKSEYKRSIKILDGDFIRIEKKKYFDNEQSTVLSGNLLEFTNPSVQDFLENKIRQENELSLILSSLRTYYQFEYFYNTFLKNGTPKVLIIAFIEQLRENICKTFETESYNLLLKRTTLAVKAISLSDDMLLFSVIKQDLDYIITSNRLTNEIINLFDSLKYLDEEKIPEVKTFLNFYEDSFLINMEVFDNFYNFKEYQIIVNFLENFEDLFTDKEKESIRNYFLENNEKMAHKLIESDYLLYDFEEQKNKFSDVMEYFDLTDDDIGCTLSCLEEKYAELMSDYVDINEFDNQLSNEDKDISIQYSEEMSDNEIIEMFEELKKN